MRKYQLSISISKAADKNSAATKAVADCNAIFSELGYEDYNLVFTEGMSPVKYYGLVFLKLLKFFTKLGRNSIVAVQYPMLNNVFKYFIKAGALKKIKFFCITHDIESLRLGGNNPLLVQKETGNLNFYDYLIVHNNTMLSWLQSNGTTSPMYPLGVFDYLSKTSASPGSDYDKTIVYAGNLAKSRFIYQLNEIAGWHFNLYGPNYDEGFISSQNVTWHGQFPPDEIVTQLHGAFGLIWDGESINEADAVWGNYLKFNNPHKFSLYLAAGLPVIAPADSAIGKMIVEKNIGLLINNLYDLKDISVAPSEYEVMKQNCLKIKEQITTGYFFRHAVKAVEEKLVTIESINMSN